jgi:prepilin-type N-terminal cleavage/methylation domain-containing protein
MMARIRRLLAQESGYSLIELVQVMAILGVVLTGLTVVFVRSTNAELDMNRRFQAQQTARVAVDKMRREIRCAKAIAPAGSSSAITVTVPAQCPSAGGVEIAVVYDTQLVSAGRYRLRRAGVPIADYVRAGNVFTYTAPTATNLGTLRVDLPINIQPPGSGSNWELAADMVLRNTTRT